jgi:hypothetical protein
MLRRDGQASSNVGAFRGSVLFLKDNFLGLVRRTGLGFIFAGDLGSAGATV